MVFARVMRALCLRALTPALFRALQLSGKLHVLKLWSKFMGLGYVKAVVMAGFRVELSWKLLLSNKEIANHAYVPELKYDLCMCCRILHCARVWCTEQRIPHPSSFCVVCLVVWTGVWGGCWGVRVWNSTFEDAHLWPLEVHEQELCK